MSIREKIPIIKSMTPAAITAAWLKKYAPDNIVSRAYETAQTVHKNEIRQDGRPYISHALTVAKMTADLNLDDNSIAAAFLHDTIENTDLTIAEVREKFGEDTANLVDGLTKLRKIQTPNNPTEAQIENLRKFFIASSGDLRVVLIKLMDRLHNMRTLKPLNPPQQKRISWETMEIYAPLAYRLGMYQLSAELSDLAFPYLYPIEYRWLIRETKEKFQERAAYTEKTRPIVEEILRENGIENFTVNARAKSYTSLYKKLLRYDMDFAKIYDLVALRIILETVDDCYAVLGLIHSHWPPLPGRFKDYVARPKPNGYKSLHTTVFCLENKVTEFQILTRKMHEENEMGIAASWVYQRVKENKEEAMEKWQTMTKDKDLRWVEQLRDWQKNFDKSKARQSKEEFFESLKTEFFKDRIFIMTPENEIIDLPAGATPIDFAYRIHTDIGNQCIGAKINGKISALDQSLKSGDVVEIIIQPNKKPSPIWLEFARTNKAKESIRQAIRQKTGQSQPEFLEFKITGPKRIGFLRDLAGAFAKMEINIVLARSQDHPQSDFSVTLIRCEKIPEVKIRKMIAKIKKMTGVKEVTYHS